MYISCIHVLLYTLLTRATNVAPQVMLPWLERDVWAADVLPTVLLPLPMSLLRSCCPGWSATSGRRTCCPRWPTTWTRTAPCCLKGSGPSSGQGSRTKSRREIPRVNVNHHTGRGRVAEHIRHYADALNNKNTAALILVEALGGIARAI